MGVSRSFGIFLSARGGRRQLPRTKKKGALRVRRQREDESGLGSLHDGLAREAWSRLVNVHPYCGLRPERLRPEMSRGNPQASARESSSSADKRDSSTGATMAWPNSNNASLSVLCSSSPDDESAQQAHIAKQAKSLTLNLTPHRAFGVTSRSPAVLVTLATPGLSGARETTSASWLGSRRTRISSRDARLRRSGSAGRTGRAPRLNAASGRGRGARGVVGGDRAVGRSRGAALDGQTSGPTLTEQNGAPKATRSSFGQGRT